MFQILDGREQFYQWDLNRKLIVLDDDISEVHFCNRTGDCSLVCEVYSIDGIYLVNVPNVLLQSDWPINVYAYDGSYTKHSESFKIVKRTKPTDYVYTETEIKRYEDLEERITALEENGVSADVDLSDYYTKTETDDAIAGAIASIEFPEGGDVDLSDYYTKAETNEAIAEAVSNMEISGGVMIDDTLTIGGAAADARSTGSRIDNSRKYNAFIDTNSYVNIDTAKKTIFFGANTHIIYGDLKYNVANTTHDISNMIGGAFVYFDIDNKTLTKTYSPRYAYLGALWNPAYLTDLHIDKNKLMIDSMPITRTGRYLNKTINCLGDSMTEGVGTTKAYHQWFGQLCGFKTINTYGVGGSSIAPKVDAIPTWDTVASFYERYNEMGAADVITVFGGVNDWVVGRELGTIDDATTDTFYGAMKALCEGLIAKYPTGDIFVFSSPQCDYVNRPATDMGGTEWANNTEGYNRKGYKLQDYANAMGEVCAIYGITFTNLTNNLFYGLSGVLGEYKNDDVNGPYGSDSLHPNAEGHKKIALKMATVINGGIGDSSYTDTKLATKDYVNNALANLPTGGGSGGNAGIFTYTTTAEQEVNGFTFTLPVVLKNFNILNFRITTESGIADSMALYCKQGNTNYKNLGTLSSGTKTANIFCVRGSSEFFCSLAKSTQASGKAPPQMMSEGTAQALAAANRQAFTLYSNTDGVMFPANTTFEVWGVYQL